MGLQATDNRIRQRLSGPRMHLPKPTGTDLPPALANMSRHRLATSNEPPICNDAHLRILRKTISHHDDHLLSRIAGGLSSRTARRVRDRAALLGNLHQLMTAMTTQRWTPIEAAVLHARTPAQTIGGTGNSLHSPCPLNPSETTELLSDNTPLELALKLNIDVLEVATTTLPRHRT